MGSMKASLIASDDQKAGRIRDKIVIYTNNQAAIRISGNPIGRSGAYSKTPVITIPHTAIIGL
jgi:hypothetical protein